MSKRKRNVGYIKPEEPAFIARMKAEAGYKEGPTVDTKRETSHFEESDNDDHNDEEPQVVVLREGDLTAEEASKVKLQIEEGPADLTQRIVFKKPDKTKKDVTDASNSADINSVESKKARKEGKKEHPKSSSRSKDSKSKALLSFNEDDETEDF